MYISTRGVRIAGTDLTRQWQAILSQTVNIHGRVPVAQLDRATVS